MKKKRRTYMGVNEDNGKRDMKNGPTKKPFIYYYFLVILIVMILNALEMCIRDRSYPLKCNTNT